MYFVMYDLLIDSRELRDLQIDIKIILFVVKKKIIRIYNERGILMLENNMVILTNGSLYELRRGLLNITAFKS